VTEDCGEVGLGENEAVLVRERALECPTCEMVRSFTGSQSRPRRTGQGQAVEYVDDEVLVLRPREPEHGRAIVLPCRHVGGLAGVPSPALGRLLAALRRVCSWAEDRCLVPKARLEEMQGHPASKGHVCFRLVPDAGGRAGARRSTTHR
jgi:hypothetical protein